MEASWFSKTLKLCSYTRALHSFVIRDVGFVRDGGGEEKEEEERTYPCIGRSSCRMLGKPECGVWLLGYLANQYSAFKFFILFC